MAPKKRTLFQRIFGRGESLARGHESAAEAHRREERRREEHNLDQALEELTGPHPQYPELSIEQGLAFEDEVARAFARHHVSAEVHDFSVAYLTPEGQKSTLYLGNLYRQVLNLTNFEQQMPGAVHGFVDASLRAHTAEITSEAEFYRSLRVRLQSMEQFPEDPWIVEALNLPENMDPTTVHTMDLEPLFTKDSPMRPWSEDTVLRLCSDSEFAVRILSPGAIAEYGPVEDLFRMGYRNLWQELIDSDLSAKEITFPQDSAPTMYVQEGEAVRTREVPGATGTFWGLEGSSFYAGSAPVFLEELVERYIPGFDHSQGIIFATPHRNLTLVGEVTSGADLLNTIGQMISVTVDQFSTQPGRISPRLHLWRDGQIETFTDIVNADESGGHGATIQVKPQPYLISLIGEGTEGFDDDSPEDDTGPSHH